MLSWLFFKFADDLREDAAIVISELHQLGIKSKLISGDNKSEVEKMAKLSGIIDYKFSALPNDKVEAVESLKK